MPLPNTLAAGPHLPRPRWPGRWRWRRFGLRVGMGAVLVIAALWAHKPLLVGFARGFRVNDPAPSDALVVLLGGLNHRPRAAAALFQQGLAPLILLGESNVEPDLGTSESNQTSQILVRQGVPRQAIVVLPGGTVTSTRDEALRVRDYALGHPSVRRITLVTTAFHTARARWIFERVLRGSGIEVHAAACDVPQFNESNWYRGDDGLVSYFSEALKTLWYRLLY